MYSSDFKTLAREYTWLTIRLRSPWVLSLISVKALGHPTRQRCGSWGLPPLGAQYSLCLLKF